mgnify:CR=1 FL=1
MSGLIVSYAIEGFARCQAVCGSEFNREIISICVTMRTDDTGIGTAIIVTGNGTISRNIQITTSVLPIIACNDCQRGLGFVIRKIACLKGNFF